MLRGMIFAMGVLFGVQAHAVSCYLTLVKGSCWEEYNVTVEVSDADSNRKLGSVLVPQGSLWARQPFQCEPGNRLRFQAHFTPVFWQKDEGKVYAGKKYRMLPLQAPAEDTLWNISVCYPSDFAEIPLPPEAGSRCACDMKAVPPVKR